MTIPWSPDAPIDDTILAPPGWFDDAPSEVQTALPGWWVGLNLDLFYTVQFLTDAELTKVANLGFAHQVFANRSLALMSITGVALNRPVTTAVDLGLRGIYVFDTSKEFNFNRAVSLTALYPVTLANTIQAGMTLAIGKIYTADFTRGLNMNRALSLLPVFPIDVSRGIAFNRTLQLGVIATLSLSRGVTVAANLAMGFPPNAAVFQNYTTVGNFSYAFPRWCNKIAGIALGGGGGGQASAAFGAIGKGGYNGEYGSRTVERGVNIPFSQTTVTGTVGAGGDRGVWDGTGFGKSGDNTTINWGDATTTGPGGAGGAGFGNNDGESPGNLSYDGISATGGATQTGNADGNPPGGGGAGSPSFSSGYAGARGQAWFRSYQ